MSSPDGTFQKVIDRVDKSLVAVMSGDYGPDGLERLDIGSGVLVRLGGREFVFTAAHNVMADDKPELEPLITVLGIHGLPRGLMTTGGLGGGAIDVYVGGKPDSRGAIEPDVAVLELGPNALLRSDRVPIEAREIGFIPPDAPERVLVAGFPRSSAAASPPQVFAEGFDAHHDVTAQWIVASADLSVGKRHDKEPASGRGLHVAWGGPGRDFVAGSPVDFPHPKGLSGGPVFVGDARGVCVVGLVRSRDGDDMWCEPVMAAVALLVEHRDQAVSDAARELMVHWRRHLSRHIDDRGGHRAGGP